MASILSLLNVFASSGRLSAKSMGTRCPCAENAKLPPRKAENPQISRSLFVEPINLWFWLLSPISTEVQKNVVLSLNFSLPHMLQKCVHAIKVFIPNHSLSWSSDWAGNSRLCASSEPLQFSNDVVPNKWSSLGINTCKPIATSSIQKHTKPLCCICTNICMRSFASMSFCARCNCNISPGRGHLVGRRFGGDAVEPEKSIKDRTCPEKCFQISSQTENAVSGSSPGSRGTAAT